MQALDLWVRTRLWHALKDAGGQIPFPIRTVRMTSADEERAVLLRLPRASVEPILARRPEFPEQIASVARTRREETVGADAHGHGHRGGTGFLRAVLRLVRPFWAGPSEQVLAAPGVHSGMQISTELPTVSAAQLQPLEGEDQPAAVLRAVGALGGIAQSLRPNGRPGTVMVTEPSLVKQVLVRGSMDEDLGLIRNFALRTAAPHGLISLSGPEHRKVRVAAAPCFRGNGLAPLESALDRRLERGLDDWTCGNPVSASKLVLDLLTKVFMEWVLGPLDPDREAELCAAEQSLLEVFHHAVPDLNQLWPSGDGEGPVSFEEMVGRFFRLRTLISDTVERGPQGMMAQLDQMLPPQGEGLPRSAQLTDHAIHLLLAGLDTVSQTVGLLMHHVGHDDALGDAIAGEAAHEERPFTEACMKEILRLYAGVPVAVRVTGAPVEVRGHVIPSHRPLMAFLICMQRDPRSFERPLDFVPERWLPGTELRMDASAYMPFGTGPHICIGESAAKLIMRRLMPAACSRFRMHTERPGLVPVLVRIVALPMRAPKVIFTARR